MENFDYMDFTHCTYLYDSSKWEPVKVPAHLGLTIQRNQSENASTSQTQETTAVQNPPETTVVPITDHPTLGGSQETGFPKVAAELAHHTYLTPEIDLFLDSDMFHMAEALRVDLGLPTNIHGALENIPAPKVNQAPAPMEGGPNHLIPATFQNQGQFLAFEPMPTDNVNAAETFLIIQESNSAAETTVQGGPHLQPEAVGRAAPGQPQASENLQQSPRRRRGRRPRDDVPPGIVLVTTTRRGGMSAGQEDKTFIEEGTGQTFRSRKKLDEYLEQKARKGKQKVEEPSKEASAHK